MSTRSCGAAIGQHQHRAARGRRCTSSRRAACRASRVRRPRSSRGRRRARCRRRSTSAPGPSARCRAGPAAAGTRGARRQRCAAIVSTTPSTPATANCTGSAAPSHAATPPSATAMPDREQIERPGHELGADQHARRRSTRSSHRSSFALDSGRQRRSRPRIGTLNDGARRPLAGRRRRLHGRASRLRRGLRYNILFFNQALWRRSPNARGCDADLRIPLLMLAGTSSRRCRSFPTRRWSPARPAASRRAGQAAVRRRLPAQGQRLVRHRLQGQRRQARAREGRRRHAKSESGAGSDGGAKGESKGERRPAAAKSEAKSETASSDTPRRPRRPERLLPPRSALPPARTMKRYLIAGLLVWVPLGITIWVMQLPGDDARPDAAARARERCGPKRCSASTSRAWACC